MLESLDSIINTRPLRSRTRTAIGSTLAALATVTARPKEIIEGDFDRFYFHHIRKTAGTSIVFAFFALSGCDPRRVEQRLYRFSFARMGGFRFVEANTQLIQDGRYYFAVSHFPAYVARPPDGGTFSFTVLRDPVRRVTSLYKYLRSSDADSGFTFRAPPEERAWAAGSFGQFLDLVPKEDLLRQLYMFSPTASVSETVDVLAQLQLVMTTESLERGIVELRRRTGLQLDVGHERTTSASVEISDAELDRARTMLAPEYEMLHQLRRFEDLPDQ